jgi:hypothetical protein
MRKHFLWIICALFVLSVSIISWSFASVVRTDSLAIKNASEKRATASAKVLFFHYVDDIYETANLGQTG